MVLAAAVILGLVAYLVTAAWCAYGEDQRLSALHARVQMRAEMYKLHLKEYKLLGRHSGERKSLPRSPKPTRKHKRPQRTKQSQRTSIT